ncbi:MAG: response regulator [Pontibacterium sp.]
MTAPIPVVICDDSNLARKQMARALKHWNVNITFAENGLVALENIRAGKGDVMFLDLNMPVLDGYETLEKIRAEDLPTMVIVVSGDIQPEAKEKILSLGALDFIQKPFDESTVSEVLRRFGLLSELSGSKEADVPEDSSVSLPDYYQEVANVSMGRAGDKLARYLNAFVHLPVPVVANITRNELQKKFRKGAKNKTHMVSQGFVGYGIAGEAILSLPDDAFAPLSKLLHIDYSGSIDLQDEILMEVGNILIGSMLRTFAQQLDIEFSCGVPAVLPGIRHLPGKSDSWKKTLSICIDYGLCDGAVNCELMLVFSEDSLDALTKLGSYI